MNSKQNNIPSDDTPILCVILARAGSKGLPNKNALPLCGQPMISYTIAHAKAAGCVDTFVLSTDGDELAAIGEANAINVIRRPESLATDTATIDAAARHAVEQAESTSGISFSTVVILYGNIPVRPTALIDDAVAMLRRTEADSVQSVHPVGKHHPYWMKQVDDEGRMSHYQPNAIYRRQDLPPVYMLDGAIIAVTRDSLFRVAPDDPHAFLGTDRRAIITKPGDTVDVDDSVDLQRAEALLLANAKDGPCFSPHFEIGNTPVGEDRPPYVIAELGVNHDGRVETACELVAAAKDAGADAVKVQLFDANHLLSDEAMLASYQQGNAESVFDMLAKLQLNYEELLQVRATAKQFGLSFIATCFSIELFDQLEAIEPDAIKFASPDAVNLPLIEAMASLDKPLLISTGTCTFNELKTTARSLHGRDVAFLHCVSAYPVPKGQANLPRIESLRQHLRAPIGYSDHTADLYGGMLAVASCNACIIEKHLTYDRSAVGPDHAASFDPDQFKQYVTLVREAFSGKLSIDTSEVEADVRHVSRQSVCAARPLRKGQVISREDLTVKRPGTGIPAAQLKSVVGCTATRDIEENQLVHADFIVAQTSKTTAPTKQHLLRSA